VSKFAKMLAAMRNNPRDVRFAALLLVVKRLGWTLMRIEGSHHMFAHARSDVPQLNLQVGKGGKAKEYQVRQMLAAADTHGLEKEDKS
jgi:hypothetical protein